MALGTIDKLWVQTIIATRGHLSVKYRPWYFASFVDYRYKFFSGFPPSV